MTELEQSSGDSKQLLHLNATQRKTVIDISGNEANSYECNLCQQVFLRVKDLVKHRERNRCKAGLDPSTPTLV